MSGKAAGAGGGPDTGGNEEFRFAQDNCSSGSECSTSSLPGSPMAADGRSRGGSSCGEELCFSVREGAAEPTGPAPLTVALDLDHTLICSVADGSPEPEFPHLESWLVYMPHVKQEVRIYERPGMREFQMAESSAGVAELFDDIEALAEACRFGDCAHNAEPGCAVQTALAGGQLDERRLASYKKLKG